jgi:aryl-alcohol dehydrogenase-like predicted oxidoreductase
MFEATIASDRAIVEAVATLAARRGISRAQVAMAWVLQRPGVTTPIIGPSKVEHLSDALASLSVKLDASETEFLESPYVPHGVAGFA